MPTEEAYLTRLADQPEDDTTRLVYADWLEERGDPRAGYLRAEVALARLEPETPDHDEGEARLLAAREGLCADWVARAGRPYDLLLTGYTPSCKIAVINSIREVLWCGLREAKDLSESLPAAILTAVPRPRAEHGRERLSAYCTGEVRAVIRPSTAGLWRFLAEMQPAPGLYSLILLDCAPEQKSHVIRTLRELTGPGLAECKHRVEAPRPLLLLHNDAPDLIRRGREQLGPGVEFRVFPVGP